ncbi:hypothetical protein BCR36DRAFT_342347 [Piromyces finnis]|uniref:MSP domain-containing protein n=1 Tax=Piromyces finnis TaxID=1754191 RepID=A0A1Y1VMA1_9FUNG|nr:hypothetical protein BCR36DRAFT_342347 [Piromyces finnis]|eukprot:ORX60056.1 hypothetical protein BCR36DRAFT_342347 [Piromyces finnis]
MRVEYQFREKINEMSKEYELNIYNNISKKQDFSNKIENKIENENNKESETSDIIDKILFEKLNVFWSVWYPIVPDNVLLRIPIEQIKEGYIYYRMKYLLEKSKIQGFESIEIYQKNKTPLTKDNIIKILKSNIDIPYPEKEISNLIESKEIIKYIPNNDSENPTQSNSLQKYIDNINNISFKSNVDSPYISTLSFNLKYPVLVLNKYPLTRDLFLHNSSRIKDTYFRIQVYPPEYFEVKPSFGLIPKNNYLLVKIRFKPQPYLSCIKPEIFGYLKVRSLNGYSLERISLYAINYPSIKLSINKINIGYCPNGYSRNFSFYVTNLTSTTISVSLLLKDNSNSNRFIFPFESDELCSNEKKMYIGKFLPTKKDIGKRLTNQILVVTSSGEILRIDLCGICDESIKIYKNKLDFGPTDIYSNEITKTLVIENIDKYNKIPILMEASTNEIIINENKEIILNPLEKKKLKIKFISYYSGERHEYIYITCPFTNTKIIDVISFSGPSMIFPVYKEIYFPNIKVNEVSVIDVPLINMTNKQVNCILYMPNSNNPFNLSIKNKTSYIEFKEYEDKNYNGIKIKFKRKDTIIISIIFCSNLSGIYKIPIYLKVDKNNSIKLNNYFVYGSVYDNELFVNNDINFNKYLSFYKEKYNTQLFNKFKQLNKNSIKATDNIDLFKSKSDIFEIKIFKININYNETYKNNNIKYITLFNKTNVQQKYHIAISHPFIILMPSEGNIDANKNVDIPVTINLDLIEDRNFVEDELIFFGVITIFDDSINHGSLSVAIEGTINNEINIGIRKKISGIKYSLYSDETVFSRKFILRNKSTNSIRCNVYLKKTDSKLEKIIYKNPYLNKRILEEMKETKERKCQFTQNLKTLLLKPFEVSEVEISYSLLNIRNLNVGFFIEYYTSLTDNINIGSKDLKDIQNMEFTKIIVLKGYTKPSSVTVIDEGLDFGSISDGNVLEKSIKIINNNHDKYNILSFAPYPFSLIGNNIKELEPNERFIIPIKYLYRKIGPQYQSLIYNSEVNSFQSLPIFGNYGICDIKFKVFQPKMVYNINTNHYIIDSSILDFGYLQYTDKLIKSFCLQNNGTLDFIINEINIMKCIDDANIYECEIEAENPNDNVINWNDNLDNNFTYKYINDIEYDMDETILKYKVKEQYSIINYEKLLPDTMTSQNDNNANKSVPFEIIKRAPLFPLTLKPNQKINIQLSISPKRIGKFSSEIKIISNWENMSSQENVYKIYGSIQPILNFKIRNYDFGIVPFQNKKSIKIEFMNKGSEKLNWHLKFDRTYYSIIKNENIEILNSFEEEDDDEIEEDDNKLLDDNNTGILFKNDIEKLSNNLCPFTFFPEKGRLKPGYTQDIEIFFNPSLPNYHYRSLLNLYTENIGYSSIEISGISSGSHLQCSNTDLNFLSNIIGKTSFKYIVLKNYSLMNLNFYIELDDNIIFSVNEEQGIIGIGEEKTLRIGFTPKEVIQYKGKIKISSYIPGSNLIEYSYVYLFGKGNYPELTADKDIVDFGISFLGYPNKATINIQNHGEPDILLKLKCYHPKIKVDPCCENENGYIVAYANSITPIKLIYDPNIVETLNVSAFLILIDDEKESLNFRLKAKVGIPKFSIYPETVYDSINFGTCLINKNTKKKFTIKNEGNTILKYEIKLNINEIRYSFNSKENEKEIKIDDKFKNVFYVSNSSGKLKVNEEKRIIIIFRPRDIYVYNYNLIFSLEYKDIKIPLTGTGGKYNVDINLPSNIVDMGTCKIDQTFVYMLPISNKSNMGVTYHVRPEPLDGDYSVYTKEIKKLEIQNKITSKENNYNYITKNRPSSSFMLTEKINITNQRPETAPSYTDDNLLKRSYYEKEKKWIYNLKSIGLNIVNPDGYCDKLKNTDIIIQYTPILAIPIKKNIRVYYGNEFKDITIVGRAAYPILSLYDENHNLIFNTLKNSPNEIPTYDLGVISINTTYTTTFYLTNEGKFGVEFFIQPITINEYTITPQSGFVHIGESVPIIIRFSPKSESVFKTNLKIFWENHLINVLIVGKGDIGVLNIYFPDKNETEEEEINFGMIPIHTSCEKSFYIINRGIVSIPICVELADSDFSICTPENQKEFLEEKLFINTTRKQNKNNVYSWKTCITENILPGNYIELLVRYWARKTILTSDIIRIKSINYFKEIPVKGKAGSISINHKGDLEFGDIANNFTFKKKITILNNGTIPCNVNFEWMTLGHQVIQKIGTSYVTLKNNYSNHDPRSPWARNMVMQEKEKNNEDPTWTARDYWRMLQNIILYSDNNGEEEANMSKKNTMLSSINANSVEKLHADDTVNVNTFALKYLRVQFSSQLKRRKHFYKLISQQNISSQSYIKQEPYLKVNPPQIQLGSYSSKEIEVEINISSDDTFLGTLICKPDIPNSQTHEISLTAVTKSICIVCDDTSILNFFHQPIGHEETIKRTFTNVGKQSISFNIIHDCPFLRAIPDNGFLRVNQSVTIEFVFKPTDFTFLSSIVYFQPNCSNPVRLRMYGGGGIPKPSLLHFKTFDFGNCMIGKSIISYLPITNEGTAILHLTKFVLVNNINFFKTKKWPEKGISIHPNQKFNLELMFYPKEENPPTGKLIVSSKNESWEIELKGSGKESVIIFSKQNLSFENCIIGNSYEQKLILKNIGDVNYPISFTTDYKNNDFSFSPENLVISPYNEKEVIVTYTPTVIDNASINMTVESPYSVNEIPIKFSSGTVKLEFNLKDLDYGIYEKSMKPSKVLKIKNCGTLKTSFVILEKDLKSMIRLSSSKGSIKAGESTDVKVSLINNEVGKIESKIIIYTDLLTDEYCIDIHGLCEESILNPEEFKFIDMGINPTNSQIVKPLILRNYGKYPLTYSIGYSYPLKLSRKMGVIDGEDENIINVIWIPNSSYDLRTTISLETNIGNYCIFVRGKSAFPEITINRLYIDYGIRAIGRVHKETIELCNNGIVPLKWNAYQSRINPNFLISQSSGSLLVKEKITLDLFFKPSVNTKISSNYIIECKGRTYKEINMVGIGGRVNIDISPKDFNIGPCPCNNSKVYNFTIYNSSDMPLDLKFENEAIDNVDIYLPNELHLNVKEKKLTKIVILPKVIGNFETTISIISKNKIFKYPISGCGYIIRINENIKDLVYNYKNIIQNYIHPWEKLTKIDDYDFWYNAISSGIQFDINLITSMIKLLEYKRYNVKNESNDNIKNFDDSMSLINFERSINRKKNCLFKSEKSINGKSSIFSYEGKVKKSTSRKISKSVNSSTNISTVFNKKKESNINKAKMMSFPSRDVIRIKEKRKSFKSNIIKMNKIIETDKKENQNVTEKENKAVVDSAITTYNYKEYLVKTFDGKMVYNRNGPMINNFFKQFEKNEEKKDIRTSNHKSILKKPEEELELVKKNSKDKLENNLLIKMKQDDINNDVYMDISNAKNEKTLKKQHFNFEKMTMIHENEETDENYKALSNINNINEYDIEENHKNSDKTIKHQKNNSVGMNNYDRKDLLNYLDINDSETSKSNELSNEEFKIHEEKLEHDQLLLSKMKNYQNILNIATISAIDIVELLEHNIDIRPIIQNIIYNIQQNISLFKEEDIKNLEDMFITIKSFKAKPKISIRDKYNKIIDKIIDVPYPKTKVSSLKDILKYNEPKLEIDILPVISRPSPFLFKYSKV